jgi:hypothetical protein
MAEKKSKSADSDGAEKGKTGKGAKTAKGAKGDKGASKSPSQGSGLTLAEHPRAARSVARAKAWGGLAGFALGGYLSLSTHTLADAGLRALAAGVVCYVAAWAISLFLWRRLVVAELSHARQELIAAEIAKRAAAEPGSAALERGPAGAAG